MVVFGAREMPLPNYRRWRQGDKTVVSGAREMPHTNSSRWCKAIKRLYLVQEKCHCPITEDGARAIKLLHLV
jgi:hypothetical protein